MEEEVKNEIESHNQIKLVIYCRVSTMNQFLKKEKGKGYISQKSLDEQLEYCLNWARKKGLIYKEHSIDFSADTESGGHISSEYPEKNRYELIFLLNDLERLKDKYKEIYLLSYNVSRISRNLKNSGFIYDVCKKNGIILCFAKEDFFVNDEETKERFFQEVLKSQKYLEELPYYVKQGQQKVLLEGKHPNGQPRFGTKVNDEGYLVKNYDEYKIKLSAIKMFSLGFSYLEIANSFNAKAYKSKSRKPWTVSMVRNIIQKRKLDPEVKAKFNFYKKSFKTKDRNKVTSALFDFIKAIAKAHALKLSVLSEESTIETKTFNIEVKEIFKSYEKEVINNRSNNSKRKKKSLEVIELLKNIHGLVISEVK